MVTRKILLFHEYSKNMFRIFIIDSWYLTVLYERIQIARLIGKVHGKE